MLREHFPDLRYRAVPRDQSRPRRGTLCIDRAKQLLGYSPDWTLRKGIAAYIEFMRRYPNASASQPGLPAVPPAL